MQVKLADGRQALTRDGDLHVDGKGRLVTSSGGARPAADHDPARAPAEPDLDRPGRHRRSPRGRSVGKHRRSSPSARRTNLESARRQRLRRHRRVRRRRRRAGRDTCSRRARSRPPTPTSPQAMVDMIEAQRAYQLTSKAIQTADQMMEIANGVKR